MIAWAASRPDLDEISARFEDALKRADQFLADKPRDLQVRFLRAIALVDLGRRKEAADALHQAREHRLGHPRRQAHVLADASNPLLSAAVNQVNQIVTQHGPVQQMTVQVSGFSRTHNVKFTPNLTNWIQ